MKNTIEAKIYEMQKRKKEMSDIFVENSNGGKGKICHMVYPASAIISIIRIVFCPKSPIP